VKFVEVETREDLERAVNDKTAMMAFYNNNNKEAGSRTRNSPRSARSTACRR
jgi:hypothetical protein